MSERRGTFKMSVGITLCRLASEVANRPGAGLPPSMYSVPPLRSTRLKLWLAPKVWLHGSQSRITRSVCGFSRNGQICALACWLDVSMRWALMTAFDVPVQPEVNRKFAMVSGVTAAKAFATADVSDVAATDRNEIAPSLSPSPCTILAECSGLIAASAGANGFRCET